jgi:hypothetical protein
MPHTIIPIFFSAMSNVFRDNTVGIKKSLLCKQKRNTMLELVFFVLFFIPFKGCFFHDFNMPDLCKYCNIIVWVYVWLYSRITKKSAERSDRLDCPCYEILIPNFAKTSCHDFSTFSENSHIPIIMPFSFIIAISRLSLITLLMEPLLKFS